MELFFRYLNPRNPCLDISNPNHFIAALIVLINSAKIFLKRERGVFDENSTLSLKLYNGENKINKLNQSCLNS